MSIPEAAEYGRVSVHRIKGWIAAHRFPYVDLTERKGRQGRHDVIIDRADLDAFYHSLKRYPPEPAAAGSGVKPTRGIVRRPLTPEEMRVESRKITG